jgi:hypothetical protein
MAKKNITPAKQESVSEIDIMTADPFTLTFEQVKARRVANTQRLKDIHADNKVLNDLWKKLSPKSSDKTAERLQEQLSKLEAKLAAMKATPVAEPVAAESVAA